MARDYQNLDDLISTSYPYVGAHEKISECIERLKDYAEDSIPVLSEEGKILGVITAYDIVEAVDEEMGEDYAKLAGLTAEELGLRTGMFFAALFPLVGFFCLQWMRRQAGFTGRKERTADIGQASPSKEP